MTGPADDRGSARRREAELLADIGVALWPQDLRLRVTLPGPLAARAAAAWHRDDQEPTDGESAQERVDRDRAGQAALIGLAIVERGVRLPGGEVAVDIDAWSVGAALTAADDAGRLDSPPPPA